MYPITKRHFPVAGLVSLIILAAGSLQSCTPTRKAAPAKKSCKAGEQKDAKTGECKAGAAVGSGANASPGGTSSQIGSGSGSDSSTAPIPPPSPDTTPDSTAPEKPVTDSNNDGIPDTGEDKNNDGIPDPAPLDTSPGRDLDNKDAETLDRRQDNLRYTQFPQGFSPADGWDIGGGVSAPGFMSTFSTANTTFGSARVPVAMWIGRDRQNSLGAVVAFAQFADPKAAKNVKFLYRRKTYDPASLVLDGAGQFGGSMAIDVQMMFDYESQGGSLKCKTAVAQLDGRYLAIDPQSMAPREVYNAEASCGKQ